jgi:hypothetical protein
VPPGKSVCQSGNLTRNLLALRLLLGVDYAKNA